MILSIIMSVHNGERTLRRAIDSILVQTFSDFEFIICDDASTDSSWNILNECCMHDSRIRILQNGKNCGLAFSLNRCLKIARGEYIARQDADDVSAQNRLKFTLEYLIHNDCPYVGCGVSVFDENGVWSRRLYPEIITKHVIAQKNPFFHPTMIFRKEVLEDVNGYRVAKMTLRTEDYDLVMRLAARGIIGRNIQKYLYDVYEPSDEYKKHTLKTRYYEIQERLYGLKMMDSPLTDYIYLLKPILMCLIPRPFMKLFKKLQWKIIERDKKNGSETG